MTFPKAIRWSDKDRYFGPFTFSVDRTRQWGLILSSGDGDEYAGCRLRIHLAWLTIIISLPQIIRPWREKRFFTHLSPEQLQQMGRDHYFETGDRQYGFVTGEGVLHVYYGDQRNEWPGDKSRCFFYPWRAWRRIHTNYLDLSMAVFAVEPNAMNWQDAWDLRATVPTARFVFADFDGEEIVATCRAEEVVLKWGEGRFGWLSYLRPARRRRSLDLHFSSEVGRRKGSWKGGTIGHGVDLRSGENHEAAFRRYCKLEGLTFVGPAA